MILTGKLDDRSAPELEEEIECLCQEGVTSLTLDLRQLDAVDSNGLAVIATRSDGYKRQGHDIAVIPGSRVTPRALAEAGARDLLAPEPDESIVRPFFSRPVDGRSSERSTAMVKNL